MRRVVLAVAVVLSTVSPVFAAADGLDSGGGTVPVTDPTPVPTTDPTTPPTPPADVKITRVVIDLSDQHATFFDAAGTVLRVVPVSTGKRRGTTPIGSFTLSQKVRHSRSSHDYSVRMEHFMRIHKGVGMHGNPYQIIGGRRVPFNTPFGVAPASSGCVRMPDNQARWVYGHINVGARIVIQP